MTPSPLAAIYGRVSTGKQDDSLELQERRTRLYAELKEFNVPQTLMFADADTSGGTPIMERPNGKLLINRLKAGDVKHLIIAKLDRLGRNVVDGLGVLEFCKNHDIAIHIVDLGGETITTQGHIGRMILTLLLAVAEWERAEICDRTQKQMDNLFDNQQLTGNIPFGYNCQYKFTDGHCFIETGRAIPQAQMLALIQKHGPVTKTLVDNQAEQVVIYMVANAARNKCKYHHIAQDLNKRRITTKLGGEWKAATVGSVLNSRYTRRLLEKSNNTAP